MKGRDEGHRRRERRRERQRESQAVEREQLMRSMKALGSVSGIYPTKHQDGRLVDARSMRSCIRLQLHQRQKEMVVWQSITPIQFL